MSYFEGKQETSVPLFTPRSNWTPRLGQVAKEVHQIIKRDCKYFERKFKIDKIKPNLTQTEIKALNKLQKK